MRRKGVTLVEVAVVIAIVLIAIGLLLPLLERPRHTSTRLMTNNNLKQCALAVHSFHDNYKMLPHGCGKGGIYANNDLSMWFHLLPFVEANNLYTAGDIKARVWAYIAQCDPYNVDDAGTLNFAANVRVFGYQSFEKIGQPVNEPGKSLDIQPGPMLCGLRLSTLKDGTTNTIMMSTRYASCNGQKTWYAADALGECQLGKLPSPGVGGFMGAGGHSTPPTKAGPITAMYQIAPTELGCLPQAGVFGHSFATHGMSIALFDGSVRNIRPDMSPLTFGRALCPGDGNQLGSDWDED